MLKLKNKILLAYSIDFISFLIERIDINYIKRIILFGSIAREEASNESDVDLFIDIIGNKTQRLTRSYAERRFPGDDPFSWSVDGTKVYFISGNEYNDSDIYSIDIRSI